MSMREERRIIITMNPDQLRKLADKMEKDFPKKTIGESTFTVGPGYDPKVWACVWLRPSYNIS